jgi:hypothetical protein
MSHAVRQEKFIMPSTVGASRHRRRSKAAPQNGLKRRETDHARGIHVTQQRTLVIVADANKQERAEKRHKHPRDQQVDREAINRFLAAREDRLDDLESRVVNLLLGMGWKLESLTQEMHLARVHGAHAIHST